MSEKCDHDCRPINAYYHGRQLVEATEDTGIYERGQMHMPCGLPGCKASAEIERLRLERERKTTQRSTGDPDLDRREAELREDLRKLGLKC
jgi:hypothetical protein